MQPMIVDTLAIDTVRTAVILSHTDSSFGIVTLFIVIISLAFFWATW
jgi:hypothetical protein